MSFVYIKKAKKRIRLSFAWRNQQCVEIGRFLGLVLFSSPLRQLAQGVIAGCPGICSKSLFLL